MLACLYDSTPPSVFLSIKFHSLLLAVMISLPSASMSIGREGGNGVACCLRRGVSDHCARKLCDASTPPSDRDRYELFDKPHNCSKHLADIAICLSDGRDNTACCETDPTMHSEETSCLTLCRGHFPPLSSSAWHRFQTCLVLNLAYIYRCYREGYASLPSQPREARVTSRTPHSVSIAWRPPLENPDLVTTYRAVLLDQSGSGKHHEIVQETSDTQLTFNGLRTRGTEYAVHVQAISKSAVSGGGDKRRSLSHDAYRSLPSSVLHLSSDDTGSGSGAILSSGRALVQWPKEAKSVTLACRLRITSEELVEIEWEKKGESVGWRKLEGNRFKNSQYVSGDTEIVHLASLEIRNLVPEKDFGLYRCIARGGMRENAEIELVAHSAAASPSPSPPETPLECCQRSFVRPHCQSICSPNSEARPHIKPGAFLPKYGCDEELMNLMACTLSESRSGACCVRKKIPYHCLGLCDRDVRLGRQVSGSCLEYVEKITDCHTESQELRPRAVDGVSINGDTSTASLDWEPSDAALMYHVYHKRKNARDWKLTSTSKPSVKLNGAEQIIILAVNAFGSTGAVRFSYESNKWTTSYES